MDTSALVIGEDHTLRLIWQLIIQCLPQKEEINIKILLSIVVVATVLNKQQSELNL